jgi:hypothetical protein
MPPYLPSGYALEIVIYARRRLRHPRLSALGFEKNETDRESEKESVYIRTHVCVCVCSITVTRPRRSSFSSDEHKSRVMTDRCRSDPSSYRSSNRHASHREKMSRGWRKALRKNSSPRTEVFVYTRISASKAFCRCQRGAFMTIDVLADS